MNSYDITPNLLFRITKQIDNPENIQQYCVFTWGNSLGIQSKYVFTILKISTNTVLRLLKDTKLCRSRLYVTDDNIRENRIYYSLYCIEISNKCVFNTSHILQGVFDRLSLVEHYIEDSINYIMKGEQYLIIEYYNSNFECISRNHY